MYICSNVRRDPKSHTLGSHYFPTLIQSTLDSRLCPAHWIQRRSLPTMTFLNTLIFLAYLTFTNAGPAHVPRQLTSLPTSISTTYTLDLPSVQSVLQTNVPDVTGTFRTKLPSGYVTKVPLPSGKTSTTGKVKVNAQNTLQPAAAIAAAATSVNVFIPIATNTPATSLFPRRGDNPAPVVGITNTAKPLNTNKFYANFFLENQYEGTVSKASRYVFGAC